MLSLGDAPHPPPPLLPTVPFSPLLSYLFLLSILSPSVPPTFVTHSPSLTLVFSCSLSPIVSLSPTTSFYCPLLPPVAHLLTLSLTCPHCCPFCLIHILFLFLSSSLMLPLSSLYVIRDLCHPLSTSVTALFLSPFLLPTLILSPSLFFSLPLYHSGSIQEVETVQHIETGISI